MIISENVTCQFASTRDEKSWVKVSEMALIVQIGGTRKVIACAQRPSDFLDLLDDDDEMWGEVSYAQAQEVLC